MSSRDADVERMVAGLRRRILAAGEQVTQVWPGVGPEAMVETDRRSLTIFRPGWRLLREAWVCDAMMAVWDGSAAPHAEDRIYGLVFDRDGREHLLSWDADDLPELGRRLAVDEKSNSIEPEAFAEVLALFHTTAYLSGQLIADPAAAAEEFPALAQVPGLHPVRSHRGREGSVMMLEFQAYHLYPGHRNDGLVVREWTVLTSATHPATWTSHDIARLPVL
jgi:hypothetical protein